MEACGDVVVNNNCGHGNSNTVQREEEERIYFRTEVKD